MIAPRATRNTQRATTRAQRVYRALLRLYPADFRARYGRAMAEFHGDRLAAARAAGRSPVLVWTCAIADVLASAAAEHAAQLTPERPTMQSLISDLSFAVRGLLRRPAFTLTVVLTIALGVGANAAIFSVVSGILLRPLPYPHAERLIAFGHEPPHWLASDPDFVDYHRGMRTLDGLAAYTQREVTLSADDPERLRSIRMTEDFFPLLGVAPLIGRTFTADEYERNATPVVVLSYSLWKRRFAGERSVLGTTISIGGQPRTVVGVMPPNFDFPNKRADLWGPMPRFRPDSMGDRNNHYLFMVGRMKPGVTVSQTLAEASSVVKGAMRDHPQLFDPKNPKRPTILRVQDQLVGSTRPYLAALLGAVGFVLLVACANVANLLLVRAEGRRREMALRGALGASGARLVAHMLAESAMLALLGGVAGLAIAWVGQRALVAAAPASVPRLDAISIDWRVVAFTAAVTVVTALLIGVVPAWRAVHENAADALRSGARASIGHGAASRARRVLVAAEVALAVVTLAGAGLMLRSLWSLQGADLGFDPRGVLTAKVALSERDYDDARSVGLFDQLVERARALPGVQGAAVARWLPVVDAGGLWGFRVEGRSYAQVGWPSAVPQNVTPGYFATMGFPLLAGRDFTTADRDAAAPVVIVSKKLAESQWPGENAIGKRVRLGGESPFMTVVGIVGDLRSRGYDDTPEPTMYFPYAQSTRSAYYTPREMAIVVKAAGDPATLVPPLRAIVRSLDRAAPVSQARTLEDVVGTSVANRRFTTMLLVGFAALALALAGIGIYGVISYGVAQRTGEIGVRMALGAERRAVLGLVMAEALGMCGIGLVAGLVGSVAVARAARAMLVGVSAVDPATLACVCVALGGVAALAAAVPALRAARVNPSEALRSG